MTENTKEAEAKERLNYIKDFLKDKGHFYRIEHLLYLILKDTSLILLNEKERK